jgi:hypothetical protein
MNFLNLADARNLASKPVNLVLAWFLICGMLVVAQAQAQEALAFLEWRK